MDAPIRANRSPLAGLIGAWQALLYNYRVWTRYEAVIVFGDSSVYHVKLPPGELSAHVTPGTRRLPDALTVTILGIMGLMGMVGGLSYLYWQQIFTVTGASIFSVVTGMVLAGPPAWWLVPKLVAQPVWVIRRNWDAAANGYVVTPIATGQQIADELTEVEAPDGGRTLRPQIYRATSLYEATKAEEEAGFVQGGKDKWEAIEVGLMATTALCTGGLLILFAIVASGD
jgi:hypothetical protein